MMKNQMKGNNGGNLNMSMSGANSAKTRGGFGMRKLFAAVLVMVMAFTAIPAVTVSAASAGNGVTITVLPGGFVDADGYKIYVETMNEIFPGNTFPASNGRIDVADEMGWHVVLPDGRLIVGLGAHYKQQRFAMPEGEQGVTWTFIRGTFNTQRNVGVNQQSLLEISPALRNAGLRFSQNNILASALGETSGPANGVLTVVRTVSAAETTAVETPTAVPAEVVTEEATDAPTVTESTAPAAVDTVRIIDVEGMPYIRNELGHLVPVVMAEGMPYIRNELGHLVPIAVAGTPAQPAAPVAPPVAPPTDTDEPTEEPTAPAAEAPVATAPATPVPSVRPTTNAEWAEFAGQISNGRVRVENRGGGLNYSLLWRQAEHLNGGENVVHSDVRWSRHNGGNIAVGRYQTLVTTGGMIVMNHFAGNGAAVQVEVPAGAEYVLLGSNDLGGANGAMATLAEALWHLVQKADSMSPWVGGRIYGNGNVVAEISLAPQN